jgi:hypothetical protein
MRVRWSMVVFSIALGACSTGGPLTGSGSDETRVACDRFAAALDGTVAEARVGDAQDTRIPGAPWLRIDRFSASFADEVRDPATTTDWLERLRSLDLAARRVEIANLPDVALAAASRTWPADRAASAARESHSGRNGTGVPVEEREPMQTDETGDAVAALRAATMARIDRCGRAAIAGLHADGIALDRLRATARVPDDYVAWQRVLGLYPLTVLPFVAGVRREEASIARAFVRHADDVGHGTRAFAPGAASIGDAAAPPWPRDALGVPRLDAAARGALLAAHAPVFALAGNGDDNRFGRITLDPSGRPRVEVSEPVVYGRVAFTRWRHSVAVQLVYTAWFPRRPPAWMGDLLAGHLDGVMLRLTLSEDGSVSMLDGIHACGCWHLFVPVGPLRVLPAPDPIEEWAFVPARLQTVPNGHRIRLRLAADTHAMEGIDTVPAGTGYDTRYDTRYRTPADARYALLQDDVLRSLPLPGGGRRSLFDPDGFVSSSARAERWIFWPMGIASAGTMRQWGRHATAFAGRRHFDAPDLLDRRFAEDPVLATPQVNPH